MRAAWLITALAIVAAGGALVAGQAKAQSAWLIVPGKSIGRAVIGTPRSEMIRQMGTNPARVITPQYATVGWRYDYSPDLSVFFSPIPRDAVDSVATSSASFATQERIRVGSSGSDLIRVYGTDYKASAFRGNNQPLGQELQLCYPSGLGVWLTPNNVVRNIFVFVPGRPACGP